MRQLGVCVKLYLRFYHTTATNTLFFPQYSLMRCGEINVHYCATEHFSHWYINLKQEQLYHLSYYVKQPFSLKKTKSKQLELSQLKQILYK